MMQVASKGRGGQLLNREALRNEKKKKKLALTHPIAPAQWAFELGVFPSQR